MLYIICAVIIILMFGMILFEKLSALESRVKGMKGTLDQIAKHIDVPEHPVNERLRELVKEGKTFEAVKEARKALGLSLLEAKQYVDTL